MVFGIALAAGAFTTGLGTGMALKLPNFTFGGLTGGTAGGFGGGGTGGGTGGTWQVSWWFFPSLPHHAVQWSCINVLL